MAPTQPRRRTIGRLPRRSRLPRSGTAPFGTGMGALSRTLSGDVEPDVPLALARALTAAPQFRPSPQDVARSLGETDGTVVLDARAVDPTLVAPTWLVESDGAERPR